MKSWRVCAAVMLSLGLAACGIGSVAPAPTRLDLGLAPTGATVSNSMPAISLPPLSAARELQSTRVIWRLGAEGSPNAYATYVWAAQPAEMVRERLFEQLTRYGPVLVDDINAQTPQLRVTLMQFEQLYTADGKSNEALVSLQAVLVKGGVVLGQYRQTQRQRAQANDARAGALALREATDRMVDQLVQWVITQLKDTRS
jgi:cholesterol transport system auxiliary component